MENGPKRKDPGFESGNNVLIQDTHTKVSDTHGMIVKRLWKQQFKVETNPGRSYVRNQKYLRHSTQDGPDDAV